MFNARHDLDMMQIHDRITEMEELLSKLRYADEPLEGAKKKLLDQAWRHNTALSVALYRASVEKDSDYKRGHFEDFFYKIYGQLYSHQDRWGAMYQIRERENKS